MHDTKLAAESGLDLEMDVKYQFDEQYMAEPLLKAVKDGEIEESLVDEKVRNILRMMLRLKNDRTGEKNIVRQAHTIRRNTAGQCSMWRASP